MVWLISVAVVGCGSQRADLAASGLVSTSEESALSGDDERSARLAAAREEEEGSGEDEGTTEEEGDEEQAEPLWDSDAGVDPFEDEATLSDDSARCGNGILDEDEICEISIPAGQPGACPTRCRPEPGCPSETMFVRSCWSRCVPDEMPPAECLD